MAESPIRLTARALELFGFKIYWYGMLIALGVVAAVWLGSRREDRLNLPKDSCLSLALWAVPPGIVFARLYYVLFSWEEYASEPLRIFDLRSGGLAIYGGVIGGILGVWLFAKRKKLHFSQLADLVVPSLALAQGIGRWGNFVNGEAYGIETGQAFLRFFPASVCIDGVWHYATFFYESLWCLAICFLLLRWERKGRFFQKSGDCFWWYLLLYAAERANVEGLRTDSLYLGSVRVSQLLSLCVLLAVTLWFAYRHRKILPTIFALAAVAALWFQSPLLLLCTTCAAVVSNTIIAAHINLINYK